jgi:hypothetical protein
MNIRQYDAEVRELDLVRSALADDEQARMVTCLPRAPAAAFPELLLGEAVLECFEKSSDGGVGMRLWG